VAEAVSGRRSRALELFAPLGPTYDRYARLLSLGQDPRWRRFLVSRIDAGPGDRVLDVACGTGAVALELIRSRGCGVVGLDQSSEMLAVARRRLPQATELVEASAEELPFEDASFDGLTVTYLLRYVDDPGATLAELARVVRPGGSVASLEFAIPRGAWQPLWQAYVGAVLPAAGRLVSPAWHEVGRFLGGSIRDFWRRYPLERQLELWRAAGIVDVRHRRLSLGGGIVVWGRRGR
jgi:demethylmenaquinone methyltransferase/2-methoxy-6-polyprenyl-1,4-benzoquinol methylase